jgi:peptide/nickel transport system permease protein
MADALRDTSTPRDLLPVAPSPAGAAGDPVAVRGADLAAPKPSAVDPSENGKAAGVYSPWRSSWRTFRRHKTAMAGLVVLGLLYVMAVFADFIAPYHYDNREANLPWAPPTELHFKGEGGGFSLRPYIHPIRTYFDENLSIRQEQDKSRKLYMRFFVQGDPYRFLWLVPTRVRLFGFDRLEATSGDTAALSGGDYFARYYLMGSDSAGRDIFSRICYGSRISMTIGLVGTSLVLLIGLAIGGTSGYLGGRTDDVLQRFTEMIMLLPGFYLLLMLRFMFPANMDSTTVYFAVVLILALVNWPGLARVIRGMVLSIKAMDYIQSARAIGLPTRRIIGRHVIPNTFGYVIVSATLSIPAYILSESALSILGLGIMEPTPSWGNMLQKAMDIAELDQHPWVLWPGVFIFLAVMAFNLVGDGLRDALDPKRVKV